MDVITGAQVAIALTTTIGAMATTDTAIGATR
jgi:hypothetical protein